jgi:hypothetical protein
MILRNMQPVREEHLAGFIKFEQLSETHPEFGHG